MGLGVYAVGKDEEFDFSTHGYGNYLGWLDALQLMIGAVTQEAGPLSIDELSHEIDAEYDAATCASRS